MEQFILSVLNKYFGPDDNSGQLQRSAKYFANIGLSDISVSGAWIHSLKDSPNIHAISEKKAIYSGLVAEVHECKVLDILLYTESGKIVDIEFAAPLDDFPQDFTKFRFSQTPVSKKS